VKITREWISSIAKTQDQPTINMRGQYYPMAQDLERMKGLAIECITKGGRYGWLEKTEGDLLEQLRDKFLGMGTRSEATKEPSSDTESPEDVLLENTLESEGDSAG
jgi:hypothetical protein